MKNDLETVIEKTFQARRVGKPLERTPEVEAMLGRIVERKEREEAMLAKMTPGERRAWIEAWARGIAEQEVEAGCALDRWLNAGGMARG